MKNNNKNLYEPPAEQHYKKRYLARKLEEKEADTEIREFHDSRTTPSSTLYEAQDMEEEGGLRGMSS